MPTLHGQPNEYGFEGVMKKPKEDSPREGHDPVDPDEKVGNRVSGDEEAAEAHAKRHDTHSDALPNQIKSNQMHVLPPHSQQMMRYSDRRL
jgi:hypothetical protein